MEVSEGGVALDNDDACLTTEVAEGLVSWPRYDSTAVAAHEAEARGSTGGGGGVGFVPGLAAAGARGGIDGVRVAAERCARGHRFHGDRPSERREEGGEERERGGKRRESRIGKEGR